MTMVQYLMIAYDSSVIAHDSCMIAYDSCVIDYDSCVIAYDSCVIACLPLRGQTCCSLTLGFFRPLCVSHDQSILGSIW